MNTLELPKLAETRKKVEIGLTPLTVIDNSETAGNVLVILKDDITGDYHCHRYWPTMVGDDWSYSFDGQSVPLEAVWSWLNDPCGLSTRPERYVTPAPVAS